VINNDDQRVIDDTHFFVADCETATEAGWPALVSLGAWLDDEGKGGVGDGDFD